MNEPIMIPCEGSGCHGHRVGRQLMCAMCGQTLGEWPVLVAPPHERDDVLARIARGDFTPDVKGGSWWRR